MSGNDSENLKSGAATSLWAWAPASASLLFSATTAWLTYLYINAHDVAYHQSGRGPDHQLQPDLVNHEQLLSNARVVPALIALILAVVAFRGGPRWMAWLSLVVGVLGLVSISMFTLM